MDGSFTFPRVTPGEYYVIAELDGYVSALSLFSREALGHPTEPMVRMMASLVTPVTVYANASARADVTLVKGGSISGTVRFDDGMPDVDSRVVLQRQFLGYGVRNYYPTTLISTTVNTDDEGRFRFAGLPEGAYTVFTILTVQNMLWTDVSNWPGGINLNAASASTLRVYYGDDLGISLKNITLTAAEHSVDDIHILMSKLHTVSGTVVDATSGTPVNSGAVVIIRPAGVDFGADAEVTRANVQEDGSFHFAFVPEGEFTLNATNIHEMTREPMPLPEGFTGNRPDAAAQFRAVTQKVGQNYGDVQMPLTVHSDMTGVTVIVSPKVTAKTSVSHR
jgi:hypothetical protein